MRTALYTGDVFRMQGRGGITRYFAEVIPRLKRPAEVVVGLHQSRELSALGPRARHALRIPAFPGSARLAAPYNALLDRAALGSRRGVILHPTYYRDPRGLPRSEPLVLTVLDMTHERFPAIARRRRWGRPDPARHKAALCARADRILCISQATRRDLVELLGVPQEKTRVVLLAGRDWAPVPSVAVPGLDRPFLLWVGERHSYKNFRRTLEAWAACPEAAGTLLLCIGGGPFRPDEIARLAALGVAARVRQTDCPDPQLRWAYEQAAGLLYTSLWEGFGLPVLEAFGLGCPVVASNLSALPEVGGGEAIYVEPESTESILDGIRHCLAGGRTASGTAARQAQAARFSWDTCAAGLEAVYGELD
jgi:glycosyltransferase involved in cell wall biosynthesis